VPLEQKQPRIQPVEPPYDDDTSAVLDRLGPPIQFFRVLAHRPELARGVTGWGGYYMSKKLALTLRQREIVIDRTTAVCGADYEWGVHIAFFAEKVKLTAEQVTSLAQGQPEDDCWTDPSDRALIRAVDELHATSDLSDHAWTSLVAVVGEAGVLDVLLLAGWYHAISFAVRALRLPLEPGTSPLPRSGI
jgi:alkylhydroperoxidase family enzyme